jgi:SAM-dependent methyltransferase
MGAPLVDTFTLDRDDADVADWLRVPTDWRRPGTPGHRLYWHEGLAYGQLLPRPTPEEVPAFYDVAYYTHGDAPRPEARPPLRWRVLRHLAWRADDGREPDDAWWRSVLGAAPARVLELGCGNGGTLARLAAMGHDVTGVEPDARARDEAAARGVPVQPGTAEDPPADLKPESFDAVLLIHVLEHCVDPARALQRAASLLRDGGTLVVEVPNNACAGLARFGPGWLFLDVPRHLNFFTARSLAALISASGFTPARTDYSGYVMQFAPEWRTQQDAIHAAFAIPRHRNGWNAHAALLLETWHAPPERKFCNLRITAHKTAA